MCLSVSFLQPLPEHVPQHVCQTEQPTQPGREISGIRRTEVLPWNVLLKGKKVHHQSQLGWRIPQTGLKMLHVNVCASHDQNTSVQQRIRLD